MLAVFGVTLSRSIRCNFNRSVMRGLRQKRAAVVAKPGPSIKGEKRLDVVIVGSPNVGKSVLLNCMIDSKLAATSRKRHTTRSEILGVFNFENTQLAFYDTPGYVNEARALKSDLKAYSNIAADSMSRADVVLLVVDAARCRSLYYHDTFAELVKMGIENCKKELILVLNKVDLVEPKTELLDTTRILISLINGVRLDPKFQHLASLDTTTFMISAQNNDGVVDIKNYLLSLAEYKPWILGADEGVSDLSTNERVEQMILEKLLHHVHEEIPYIADIECTSIVNINMHHTRVKIDANIWVDSHRQQKILVGGSIIVQYQTYHSKKLMIYPFLLPHFFPLRQVSRDALWSRSASPQ